MSRIAEPAGMADAPFVRQFAARVTHWQQQHGRHHLPWQGTRDPYRIWLSEIMLQQTQVSAVIGYYQRFLSRFPTLATLAQASQEEVMPYWAGLGYYARARNLHRCARTIADTWGGRFPPDAQTIATLPGIGRSTAAAIAAFAYGERSPIMDGNVRRVFSRCFGVDGPTGASATEAALWRLAEQLVQAAAPDLDMASYTQGLMDLGATICTRGATPSCPSCPLQPECHAHRHGLQAQLPAPKLRKTVPERDCAMLVLVHDGCVLLHQRPSSGIWGGLWSLPEFPDAAALQADCLRQGLRLDGLHRMAGMRHVFTHFRLNIDPWLLAVPAAALTEPDADRQWHALSALPQTAVPAPVRKLLEGVCAIVTGEPSATAQPPARPRLKSRARDTG